MSPASTFGSYLKNEGDFCCAEYENSAAVIGAAAIGLSVGSVTSAEAASFSFSYNFLSGESISGAIDGDLQPDNNTVSNLRNLSATYSGQPGTQFTFVPSSFKPFFTLSGSSFRFYGFANDPTTLTSQPNFGFFLGNPSNSNGATVGTFFTNKSSISFPFGVNQKEAENFSASRWTATAIPAPVPTPALLPGLLGMGVAALRKRKNDRSEAAEA
ncbi:MAG TPA: PTPA-CTERM sorting domain-containing protein [Trichocoleus sp.]|jgi:hypothetical protein